MVRLQYRVKFLCSNVSRKQTYYLASSNLVRDNNCGVSSMKSVRRLDSSVIGSCSQQGSLSVRQRIVGSARIVRTSESSVFRQMQEKIRSKVFLVQTAFMQVPSKSLKTSVSFNEFFSQQGSPLTLPQTLTIELICEDSYHVFCVQPFFWRIKNRWY
jgi:hypothetical protein